MSKGRCDPTTQCCPPQQAPDVDPSSLMCVEPTATNSTQQQRLGGASGPLPTAQVTFNDLPAVPVGPIITPGATITGSLKLGGQLTARAAGQDSPVTMSNGEVNVGGSSGNTGGSVGVTSSGDLNTKLTTTLQGITNSVQVSFNGGSPTVSFGAAGTFGAVQTGLDAGPPPTLIFTCSPQPVKVVQNGVEVVGQVSYTLKLTVTPNRAPAPRTVRVEEPQPWYAVPGQWLGDAAYAAWDWMKGAASDVGDWVMDHKKEILVGTVVVGVGAAIVLSGGSLTPLAAAAAL